MSWSITSVQAKVQNKFRPSPWLLEKIFRLYFYFYRSMICLYFRLCVLMIIQVTIYTYWNRYRTVFLFVALVRWWFFYRACLLPGHKAKCPMNGDSKKQYSLRIFGPSYRGVWHCFSQGSGISKPLVLRSHEPYIGETMWKNTKWIPPKKFFRFNTLQGGPLLVIKKVITPITGLINGQLGL